MNNKEKRFVKVVERNASEELLFCIFWLNCLFLVQVVIFTLILVSYAPEWENTFFPLGWPLILWGIFTIGSIRLCYKKKVYYKEVNKCQS